jgi:hypothetical protein
LLPKRSADSADRQGATAPWGRPPRLPNPVWHYRVAIVEREPTKTIGLRRLPRISRRVTRVLPSSISRCSPARYHLGERVSAGSPP